VFAAGSRNAKAEKIVLVAIKAAASFGKSRFKAADELAEPASVAAKKIILKNGHIGKKKWALMAHKHV
jgi:uncharacterized protein YggU (UPF0235/DUF167 family)